MSLLQVENVSCHFGSLIAVNQVSLGDPRRQLDRRSACSWPHPLLYVPRAGHILQQRWTSLADGTRHVHASAKGHSH